MTITRWSTNESRSSILGALYLIKLSGREPIQQTITVVNSRCNQCMIEHLSSYVIHSTAKQVITRRRKNENVYEMWKNENCTCKACKNIVFHCQICKFVTFLSSSSSWLLKLPISYKLSLLKFDVTLIQLVIGFQSTSLFIVSSNQKE